MREIQRGSVRPAPWGRKRYFAPLPVLSVLLLATVVANPDILRTDFLIYQDSGLSIVARISQVVHLSSPTGTVVGTMTITNTHTFGISVSALGATLVSITGSPISLTISTPPARPDRLLTRSRKRARFPPRLSPSLRAGNGSQSVPEASSPHRSSSES